MPGGISRAMRMIPVIVDIARDIEKICPKAYFLNYSNPMAIICRAVDKAGYKTIGLCHSFNHIEAYLANFIGAERSKFRCYGIGINHLTFMYDIRYKGKNAIPAILKRYSGIKAKGIDYSTVGPLWFDEIDPSIPVQVTGIYQSFLPSFSRGDHIMVKSLVLMHIHSNAA